MSLLGLKSKKKLRKPYLIPTLEFSLIVMSMPDKSQSDIPVEVRFRRLFQGFLCFIARIVGNSIRETLKIGTNTEFL